MGWQDVAAGSHVCQPKPRSVGLGLRPSYYLLVGDLSASAEAILAARVWAWLGASTGPNLPKPIGGRQHWCEEEDPGLFPSCINFLRQLCHGLCQKLGSRGGTATISALCVIGGSV